MPQALIDVHAVLRPGVVCAVVSLLGACSPRAPVTDDSGGAGLMRNLSRCRGVDVELAAGAAESPRSLEESVARAASRAGSELDLGYRITPAALPRDDEGRARIVVGTTADPRARALAARTGLVLGDNDRGPYFQWRDQPPFNGPLDGLIATFEDPERVGLPVTLYLANSAEALPAYLGQLEAGWRPWVRMFSAGELVSSGPLQRSGAIVAARLDRAVERRRMVQFAFQDLPPNDFGFVGGSSAVIAPEAVKRYITYAGAARARVAAWAAPNGSAPLLSLYLYALPEEFVAIASPNALAHWNPVGNAVHALCAQNLPHDGGAAIARAGAHGWLGDPAAAWLADGAATDASASWWTMYLERWISWIHRGGLLPPLSDIVDARASERFSPHLLVPARAALFRYLLESRGKAFMRELWRGTAELSIDADLERAFDLHWSAIDMRYRDGFAERRLERSGANRPNVFAKGVGLESPGTDPARGFGSGGYERGLAEIKALGANSVAVSAFAVAERDPPRIVGLGAAHDFGLLGGDVPLYVALTAAKGRGFTTLFLPSLLSAPGGSWNGGWVRPTRASSEEFFEGYARFVVHCGLLCELSGVDFLSLGSDIPDVARGTAEGRRARPEEVDEKRAGWARVITAARAAFAGRITFTASSVREAQKIAFWRDLDSVGFAMFFPEREQGRGGTAPNDPILLGNLFHDIGELEKVAASHDKPLLVTQVGFTAAGTSPRFPRVGPGSVDLDVQAEAFALLEMVVRQCAARGRLQGVYVWRWSTDPNDRGANARDYLFAGRPAEAVVTRMFTGL